MDVKNVVANWNFHQLFFLFKVLKTEPALLLICHVCKLFLFCTRTLERDRVVFHSVHDFEVDPDDGL